MPCEGRRGGGAGIPRSPHAPEAATRGHKWRAVQTHRSHGPLSRQEGTLLGDGSALFPPFIVILSPLYSTLSK